MKKTNKKGFTLAELLIVIAIIAVLIAIAIPTFSGALENAKRQTDHANMRNAYAIMQVANLNGGIILGDDGKPDSTLNGETTLYFGKDGKLVADSDKATKAYEIQAKHDNTTISDCKGAVACKTSVSDLSSKKYIKLTKTDNVWDISVD